MITLKEIYLISKSYELSPNFDFDVEQDYNAISHFIQNSIH